MPDTVDAEGVLQLITSDKISHPNIRKEALRAAAATMFGEDSGLMEIITSVKPEDTQGIKNLALDLKQLATSRKSTATAVPRSEIPSDDDIKDRISRVFMSSMVFKICAGVLALGATLFGINMGILTLDTSAANKVKNDAVTAANTAKQEANNAVNSITAAISDAQLRIAELVNNKIDIKSVENRVADLLSDRMNPKIGGLDAKITKVSQDIDSQNTRVEASQQQIEKLQNTIQKTEAKYEEAQKLFDRWQSAVEAANKTTADQTVARVVWLVLRRDAWFLLGSFGFSLIALGLAIWSLRGLRKTRRALGTR